MKIYTPSGPLTFRQFTFPDGQRHLELLAWDPAYREATIETRIANAEELFDVLLAKDALDHAGFLVSLDIRYLLGARMDRRIAASQPFTLQLVARLLNGAGFRRIRVLDPHSEVALRLLDAEPVYPLHAVACVLAHYSAHETVIVAPDAGAAARIERLMSHAAREDFAVVQGVKRREPATGALSGFAVRDASRVQGQTCLLLDDICDGGGTFVGLAAALADAGALAVDLFVTHGIFSKGTPLPGIRNLYTTDSFQSVTEIAGVTIVRVSMATPVPAFVGV